MGREPTRADDERLLAMLDARDHDGLVMREIAERFGTSKSAVAGALGRVGRESVPCLCEKPENMDGALSRRWWAR